MCDQEFLNDLILCVSIFLALFEEEILANSILFFLTGYDTTSTAISFIIYHLALHPEVQQRLDEEITEKWTTEVRMPT